MAHITFAIASCAVGTAAGIRTSTYSSVRIDVLAIMCMLALIFMNTLSPNLSSLSTAPGTGKA